MPTGARVAPLDGLRGIAALIVVVGHILSYSVVSLANPFRYATPPAHMSRAAWLFMYTPLHVVWAGQEAVIVFFVLSGFVLALPTVGKARWFELSYFPRRLVRLYFPVWGALCLAWILNEAYTRTMSVHATWILNGEAGLANPTMLWHGAELVLGSSSPQQLDPVIWSLRWEVIFSMTLPLFIIVARTTRRLPLLAWLYALASLVTIGVGARLGNQAARYMPIFMLGTLMAYHHDAIVRRATRIFSKSRLRWVWVFLASAAALSLLSADWWVRPHGWNVPYLLTEPLATAALIPVVALGASLVVLLALTAPSWRWALATAPVHWSGTRSYSLYLVHLPVVITLAFLWNSQPPHWQTFIPVALAASLVVGEVFFRVVEDPAHQLSRRIATWLKPNRTGRAAS